MATLICAIDLRPLHYYNEYYHTLLTPVDPNGYIRTNSVDTTVQLLSLFSNQEDTPGYDEYVYDTVLRNVYADISPGGVPDDLGDLDRIWYFYEELYAESMGIVSGVASGHIPDDIVSAVPTRQIIGDIYRFRVGTLTDFLLTR